jgi:glucose-1-phosphate thymidylyltransferase
MDEGRNLRPKVACHYLLEKMRLAGITKTYIVLRQGKWDIPAYLGDGAMLNMHLAYLMMGLPFGVPYTLDQAYPFVQNSLVALGFPDVIFWPEGAFVHLLDRQAVTQGEIVLGLFPTDQPQKGDMVDLDEAGRVRRIIIKSNQTDLRYGWIIAVWTPVFTKFMHEYLVAIQAGNKQNQTGSNPPEQRELFVGDVIQAAIDKGLPVETVLFPHGTYLDIGTPDELVKAVHNSVDQMTESLRGRSRS